MKHVIAYDLGTGGCKTSLYDADGRCLAGEFHAYETRYPQPRWHEQRPEDWWKAIVDGTRRVMSSTGVARESVAACAISGHSLGVVPVDAEGGLIGEWIPIWSDSRPDADQTEPFFRKVSQEEWYAQTGNGFPPPLYSVFKMMWMRDHQPDAFRRVFKIIGTKDYLNLKMTDRVATDVSYASGCGVFDLVKREYSPALLSASGLPGEILPDVLQSTDVVGSLTAQAAAELCLPEGMLVMAGGVDNSCMSLGARAYRDGRVYNSLGSSSWIAASTSRPLMDVRTRPYVFAHVVPGQYVSACGVFSTGTSMRWMRDQLCSDLVAAEKAGGPNAYSAMCDLAATSPLGSRGLLFNPTLAGGSSLDQSPHCCGGFVGLTLGHTRADMIRATLEGVAMALRVALDALEALHPIERDMIVVGGGAKNAFWRQIYADVYGKRIVKTSVDQQAAALGAAALALVGAGLWKDFSRIDELHEAEAINEPDLQNQKAYAARMPLYRDLMNYLSSYGDAVAAGHFAQKSSH
ncbi:MAG TPA: FGGY-family carbohydrate kinase [Planctomycetota bacterium]|jgi:xylulokinase